jgi:hypothetical protein
MVFLVCSQARVVLAVCFWVVLAGCGYQWVGLRRPSTRVTVRAVRDRAGQPLVAAALTRALRWSLQRHGSGRWRQRAVLQVELLALRRRPSLYQRRRWGAVGVLGYRLTLRCSAQLVDPISGQPLRPLPLVLQVEGETIHGASPLQTEALGQQRLRLLAQRAADIILLRLFWQKVLAAKPSKEKRTSASQPSGGRPAGTRPAEKGQ